MNEPHESSATPDPHAPPPGAARSGSSSSDQTASRKSARSAVGKTDKSETKLLAITIDADTARVVRVEGLDATGARHELSDTEKAIFVKQSADSPIEELMAQAFEAGIACVLDGDAELDTANESPEDAELRRRLLAPLIERSAAKHLMERAVLNRAMLRTLIDHATP